MSDEAKAILAAGAVIAAAIYFKPGGHEGKYQMVAVNSGVPMRLNVTTGQIDWCPMQRDCETLMAPARSN